MALRCVLGCESEPVNNFLIVTAIAAGLSVLALAIVGWVMNIITLCHMGSGHVGELIVRVVGIFVAPVGAVAGRF
jgi:hypothetical protein